MSDDSQGAARGRRLFASSLPPSGGDVVLDPAASAHARVLRLQEGDAVRLFDGRGLQALGRIVRFNGDQALCEANVPERLGAEQGRVVLVQCLPKASKLDVIVRMTTELGVSEIHLATSERTVLRLRGKRAEDRLERLRRVAREAARQSGYDVIPVIHPPVSLMEAAARAAADPEATDRWVLTPGGPRLEATTTAGGVWLVVGPEGGLAGSEIDGLGELGFFPSRMTVSTLRVETAAPVAVALALDRLSRS